jgi:hypothetical protein
VAVRHGRLLRALARGDGRALDTGAAAAATAAATAAPVSRAVFTDSIGGRADAYGYRFFNIVFIGVRIQRDAALLFDHPGVGGIGCVGSDLTGTTATATTATATAFPARLVDFAVR